MEGTLPALQTEHPAWIAECRAEIDRNFADPQLGVEALARAHGVHRATLFRAFLGAHGISPSQYLQSRRVHEAMALLRATDLPVKLVAGRCGMKDANYLARVLRGVCGLTPRQFRAGFRGANHLGSRASPGGAGDPGRPAGELFS
jgi:transcriptional regulator GlxA family with amidase domain